MIPESEEVRAEYARRWNRIKPYFWQDWLDKFESMPTDKLMKYYLAAVVGMAIVSMGARGAWTAIQYLSEREEERHKGKSENA